MIKKIYIDLWSKIKTCVVSKKFKKEFRKIEIFKFFFYFIKKFHPKNEDKWTLWDSKIEFCWKWFKIHNNNYFLHNVGKLEVNKLHFHSSERKLTVKCFKICHILYVRKPKVALSVFHFVLLNFFPNQCPGLCRQRPGHSLGKK